LLGEAVDRAAESLLFLGRYACDAIGNLDNRYFKLSIRCVTDGNILGNPKAPIVTKGKTNLDGLAWKTGRLVIGVFEDDRPGAASEYFEIVGTHRHR
jgi:hypothetical protein